MMEGNILFKERQRFRQYWLWLLLLGMDFLFIYALYVQLYLGKPFGDKPASDIELVLISLLIFSLTFLFASFRLETIIKSDGIYVRFFPFHLKMKYYAFSDMQQLYIRKYKPLIEYGGWGLRFGFSKKGNAYSMSGNQGLQIVFSNGDRLIIGTRIPSELRHVVESLHLPLIDVNI